MGVSSVPWRNHSPSLLCVASAGIRTGDVCYRSHLPPLLSLKCKFEIGADYPNLCRLKGIAHMVRAQQKPVLRSGMATWRMGNLGGSKLQLVNSENLMFRSGWFPCCECVARFLAGHAFTLFTRPTIAEAPASRLHPCSVFAFAVIPRPLPALMISCPQ